MSLMTKPLVGNVVTVFNGNGFLARNLIGKLGKDGSQIVIAYRGSRYEEEKFRIAGGLGQIYFSHYHLKDENSLRNAMKYSNVVVNTVGKLNETSNFSFDEVHVEGARRMARIARECGVKKFIHVSSLNASPNPTPVVLKKGSNFLRSKYYGELAVREEFPEAIIIRPADIVGEQDDFINHFTHFQRNRYSTKLALWDYYHEVEKQPVFIRNVSDGIANAILDNRADGRTFQAVGPYRYNFIDLIEYIRACAGQEMEDGSYQYVNLRYDFIMRMVISTVERLQKYPFITWERVEKDSISDYVDPELPTLEDLGVQLTPLENEIQVLAHYRPRDHRVDIPFESALRIPQPKKLNVALG